MRGALAGVRVLDFSTLLPGPMTTLFMAEAGAEVIKIERPGKGDEMRSYVPRWGEDSINFHLLNRGKKSVVLDLKSPEECKRLRPLIETTDVLVEQFRPGVMARLGLGYEHIALIKPDIVYCSITGYGQSGPKKLQAGHDLNYQGDTGLLALSHGTDESPVVPPMLAADIAGGTYPALVNILLALRYRDQTGQGAHLDIAMADNLFPLLYWAQGEGQATGRWPGNGDALTTGGTPRYRLYPTADGRVAAVAAIEIAAAEVNFPDILYMEGSYQSRPALPFSPGLAGAGWVAALGPGVTELSLGQRVAVLPYYGTYAEKVKAPAGFCFPLPDAMPFEVAAALGLAYQTAYFALVERAKLRAGETVLVLGAKGGVGMAAILLAKALGAGNVIAATRGAEGELFARALGADHVVDSVMDNLHDGLRDAVRKVAVDGADVVIDPVGGGLSAAALRAMAWSGRLVVIGFASGNIPSFPANYLLVKNITVSRLQWTDYRARQIDRVHAAQQTIFKLWAEGRLSQRISRTLPLEQFVDALAELKAGKARGKTVLLTGKSDPKER